MSILSTNNKIVRVGDAYSAGSGIDITDKVISVSDDLLNEISAISATVSSVTGDIGSQIDYISGTVNDLSGDIDYISANAGRTYSGIDPIVVNNDENKISASTLQLSAGDNITLTEEGNIVRIDGQAGGSFDPTYMSAQIDNKLNKNSIGFNNDNTYVTGISGKEISASWANYAHSATDAVFSIHSNDSMTAQTARFDENGHSISSTYSSLYELSSFVNSSSGNWNDISALNNKKEFDVQAPLIIAEETVSSLKIGISGISADEWNSVYDTVYNGSGSWTGGGGGSVDTVPFVVFSPLTTGFTGTSAYIGLENDGEYYAKNSAFTFSNSYLTGVSGNRVSAYRTYSAYTARYAYTAQNAANAQTAQTAYYDSNGNYIVSLPSVGTLDPTATYSLKWNGNSSYYWSKDG